MQFLNIKISWPLFGLCVISAVILISHTLYIFQTHQYPEQDEHVYLSFAVQFYDIFKHPSSTLLSEISDVNRNRQPFYGLVLSVPLLLFGTAYTYKIALWLNGIWYIATLFSIYALGREFLTKKASILAAYIFAFYGFPLFYLHFTYSETFVTCMIMLTLLFLAKTKNFTNKKYAIIFSIFFALANLSRWITAFFVLGPVVLALILGLRQVILKRKTRKNILFNFFLFMLLGVTPVLSLYYIPNFSFFSSYVTSQMQAGPAWVTQFVSPEIKNSFSVHSFMFYFNILSQQTVLLFTFFVAGFIVSVLKFKKYSFLLLGFIIPYMLLTFGVVLKFDRYIVPIYPMMALISVVVLDYIKNKRILIFIFALAIIISFLNFLGASWGIGPMGQQGLKDIVLPQFIRHPRRIYLTPMVWPPRKEEVNAELIIDTIEQDFGNKSLSPAILITFDYHPFGNAIYSIIAYHKRYLLKAPDLNISHIAKDDYARLFRYIKTTNYILVKDSKPVDTYVIDLEDMYIVKQFNRMMMSTNGHLPSAFVPIKTIPIPLDNTNITIYKKTRDVMKQDIYDFAEQFILLTPEDELIIREAVQESGL